MTDALGAEGFLDDPAPDAPPPPQACKRAAKTRETTLGNLKHLCIYITFGKSFKGAINLLLSFKTLVTKCFLNF
jgi:hypothetical protein